MTTFFNNFKKKPLFLAHFGSFSYGSLTPFQNLTKKLIIQFQENVQTERQTDIWTGRLTERWTDHILHDPSCYHQGSKKFDLLYLTTLSSYFHDKFVLEEKQNQVKKLNL